MSEASGLKNLGKVSTQWLNEAGIYTLEDLREIGPVQAYVKVRLRQHRASLNLLYAPWAALENIDWRDVPLESKELLKHEVETIFEN